MKFFPKLLAAGVALATAQVAMAGTGVFFNPLTQSTAVAPSANHVNELNSPWQVPAGVQYMNLTSLSEAEADANQSIVRVSEEGVGGPSRLSNASMFDMISFDETGSYIFIPHETFTGAGVSRYSFEEDKVEVLFSGDSGGLVGDWTNDWGAFDPSTYTPNGTLLLGEEWSGEGRIMEVLNPKAPVEEIQKRELHSIANVSHEGLRFSRDQKTLYFVDENRSGSIYKFVMPVRGDYTKGQTFVLQVTAFDGDAVERFDREPNIGTTRTGEAVWVPLTDAEGNVLDGITNPFEVTAEDSRPGRTAADDVYATPFGRPEDMEIGRLKNGNEVMYFAATSEQTVYSVEMTSAGTAFVREFASEANTPKNLGFDETTGVLNSPDNLAQDAYGNIYIIEDAPNSSDVGGDIWFVRDSDEDGVAESIDHFLSIQVPGAEATGMIFNPIFPTQFVVAVQHPASTNLEETPEGFGDALWLFDLEDVVSPYKRSTWYGRNAWATQKRENERIKRLIKATP
ncbi:MAG: alkaline phosphatase PhoX [Cellvibrionaceae bacterium]